MPKSARSWSAWSTLRVRMTLWYLLLLSLTLSLFSGYLYFRLRFSLLNQLDMGLEVAASQALVNIDNDNGYLNFYDGDYSQTSSKDIHDTDFAVRLITADGLVWDGFGEHTDVPMWIPAKPGYATLNKNTANEPYEGLWRIYSQPVVTNNGQVTAWLQTAQTLEPLEKTLEKLRAQLLLGLPLALLLTGGGGLFLANRALRPMDRITRTAQAISAGDLNQRIDYQGPADEIGDLANTFDQMLDRLQAAFLRERRFTADVSHELRTPLTALKGRIGVTLTHPRTQDEYESTLKDLEKEVDRLIRLSNDLLFLTRLDQGQLQPHLEPLNLSDLIEATIEQVQPLAEIKDVKITGQALPDLNIQGDPDYLIRLFLNLLDNAIKYSPAGGQVTIQSASEGNEVYVAISDTGPGILSKHLPQLFERFYRVEAARSRDQGGAGLGLAIAYEIVRAHRGQLKVQSNPGQGSTFSVYLPVG